MGWRFGNGRVIRTVARLAGLPVAALPAAASEPQPWQIGFQPAVTPIAEMVHAFNNGLLIVVTLISLFVLALLIYCIVRFNARMNPVPSRTSHNTLIEVLWTVLPILILVGIAVPSFSMLFAQSDPARAIEGFDPDTDGQLVIKATASQWYWSYDYPDNDISFSSFMLSEEDRAEDPGAGPRLLAVDRQLVVPVGTVVRVQVTADPLGVIHAFAVPAFAVKVDAVPGRLNEVWFRVDREGVYYGQCSELCGRGHAFMPIAVRAVPPEVFDAWAATAADDLGAAYEQLAQAIATPHPTRVAGADN